MGRSTQHDDPKGRPPYHYTDAREFEGILRTKGQWATHVRHLNDRNELLEGERLLGEVAKALEPDLASARQKQFVLRAFLPMHEELALSKIAHVFVASLSEYADQLSQWRGYGAGAAGYAIGINRFRLTWMSSYAKKAK